MKPVKRLSAFRTAAVALLLVAGCGEDTTEPAPLPGGAINGLPTEPVVPGETITLDGSTLTPPAGLQIVSVTWDWGDGTTETSSPTGAVSHSYEEPGVYTLTVTVEYDDSRTRSWRLSITVSASVAESARGIPMAYNVDVVVVGGSTGAVAAAVAAAGRGASGFVAAPRPYLGEDVCGPLLTWLEPGETAASALAMQIFAAPGPQKPLDVKRTLDQALEAAGVRFLYGSYATELLRDAGGELAGVVIANRTGRQAVVAKVMIDATDRAWTARMAGAGFQDYPAGPQEFTRVVIGGSPRTGAGVVSETLGFQIESRPVYKYTLTIDMPDGSWRSFAEAEQLARDMTWDVGQADDSDTLFQVPPDPMRGEAPVAGAWPGAAAVNLDAFRPSGIGRLYVLGGCADVSREAARMLVRPLELIDVGTRIGEAAAAEAAALPAPTGVRLAGFVTTPLVTGEVKETLTGVRPTDSHLPAVPAEARPLPVIGEYDVVVIGGGTGGAPAGIGAARKGAKTLVVEYLHGLGGVATLGLIGKYYHGYREGFTKELDQGLVAMTAAVTVVGKAEWLRKENREAGADIWFGALGCGAFVEAGCVKGAVVATPEGRGVVLAKVVIDSTGNADIAAAAGAECTYTGGEHVGVQGAGLPPVALGASYTNTDYTFADDTDVMDFWHLFVWAREKFAGAYDLGQLVDTRERRRIVGDLVMTPMDIVNGRTYPDTVAIARSNFDSHGFTVHPFFLIFPPDRDSMTVNVPYRCLLPTGLDGILVTGLGVSAHRDAMPVIRMQPDVQNQGYAAGHAAAMAAEGDVDARDIDIKALQQHLVDKGCLPAGVLTDTDSYPYSAADIQQAVNSLAATAGVVVDDADGAPIFETTGTWVESSATSGYYGSGYKHNDRAKGPTAKFTPALPAAGTYEVYLRWTAYSNRSTVAPVEITHSGGVASMTVDQTQNGGQWNLLGTYDFAADGTESVLVGTVGTEADRYVIADAVRFTEPGAGGMDPAAALSVVLTQPAAAIPLLGGKHNDPGTSAEGKLTCAHVLGMLGDATGAQTLADTVAGYAAWDTGWNYTGMGQFGQSCSTLDSYIIALGRAKSAVGLAPILDKVALLDAAKEFSHHRAAAVALESIGSPTAAQPLADLLAKPGMTGYHVTTMAEARTQYGTGATETGPRNNSLRELVLARALYRCGDAGGVGKAILEDYARDLRGHYSRHARAVLAGQ